MRWLVACAITGLLLGAAPTSQTTRPARPVTLRELIAKIPRDLNPDRNSLTKIQTAEFKNWLKAQEGTIIGDTIVLDRDPTPTADTIVLEGSWQRGYVFCSFPMADRKLFEKTTSGTRIKFVGVLESISVYQTTLNGETTIHYPAKISDAKMHR